MDIWLAANVGERSCGGIARSMREMAQGLRRRGHSARVCFGGHDRGGINYLLFAFKLGARLLVNAGNPPDWIIARSTDGFVCALVAACLRMKTNIAVHNHGWEEIAMEIEQRLPRAAISHPTTWRAALLRLPVLRMTLSLCDCCISGTVHETRWLSARYFRYQGKMRYVPNGVSISQATYDVTRSNSPPLFLAVGGWTWKKNLEHAVDVFKELNRVMPAARLVLVGARGKSPGGIDFGVAGRIEIAGIEEPDRMSDWYAKCPYCIVSSRYEGGHSFTILEALSWGCVVFATPIASTMEIINDRVNGFFITGCDAAGDAGLIAGILEQKELLRSIRLHAWRSALRNRWDRQIERMERALCKT